MATHGFTVNGGQTIKLQKAFGAQFGYMDVTDPDNPVPRDATNAEIDEQLENFATGVHFGQDRRTRYAQSDNAAVPF